MTPPRRIPEGTSPQDATTASSPSMPRKAPGVKDVAALAGVSVGSVSNVINRRDSVRPDVRERVEAAIAQLGYKPNPTAQALRRGTSPLVGVAVFDLTNPFFMEAAAAMERVLSREGYIMTLSSTHASVQGERDLLEALGRQAVRGVLLTPADSTHEAATRLVEEGTPVVLFDAAEAPEGLPSVSIDDRAGAALAIEHLLALGHERICFLNGPADMRQSVQRLAGVRDAIEHWQRLTGSDSIQLTVYNAQAYTAQAGYAATKDTIAEARATSDETNPTAVFCANDLLAVGVMSALRVAGVSIPDDVSVIGFDDIPLAAQMPVPLTTIRQPMDELGAAAAELLLSGSDAPAQHQTFSPVLTIRESTAKPRE